MKLIPDSSEAENLQASTFADCQGRGSLELGSRSLPPSAGHLSPAGAEGSRPCTRTPSRAASPQLCCHTGRSGAGLDAPQGLGSGFIVSSMRIAGLTLGRCPRKRK